MDTYQFTVGISLGISTTPEQDENLQALPTSKMKHVEIGYAAHCDQPGWAAAVRNILDPSDVNINSVHAPFSREVDVSRLDDAGCDHALQEIGKAITLASKLGAGIVVVHGSAEPIELAERPKRIARSKDSLSRLVPLAQEANVQLAVELLPRTCLGNTATELQELVADVPTEQVGFCLDSNHLADPRELSDTVRQLGTRIITLHTSDYDGIDERHWMPFAGIVDWGGYANALRDVGYAGAFVYETKAEGNTAVERLAKVHANFQRILEAARTDQPV